MSYEILYHKKTGAILAARRGAALHGDLLAGEGQAKLLTRADLEGRPVHAYRVDPETKELTLRDDWVDPEKDVSLELQHDAAHTSPIDGLPMIPADGSSMVTFTVRKMSASGRALTASRHDNQLHIRTTAGTLSAHQVNLRSGEASFTLRSSTETVVAEISVWADGIPQRARLAVEFSPV